MVHRKSGPKGPREGKLRDHHSQKRDKVVGASVNSPRSLPSPTVRSEIEHNRVLPASKYADIIDSGFEPSPLLSDDIIKRCVYGFFKHKYPIMPVLDSEHIYDILPYMRNDPEQYSLIAALCAFIILQPEILGPPGFSEQEAGPLPSSKFFVGEAQRARRYCDYIEIPTLIAVHTSFFLFSAHFPLENNNSAWFYLREAMTMLQLLRYHDENTYSTMADPKYATYCRRTFWLLFITERAYALQRHRPLTLQGSINLPIVDPGPEATILAGFLDLVSLFQNFDDTFLSLWNLSTASSNASSQSLIHLQDVLTYALPNVTERTEIQQADLLISRQWLKTLVWQLCLTKGLLSSKPAPESMSFYYPITIARDIILISKLLPQNSFEANGIGILEKVFDVGCSLADILLVYPNATQNLNIQIGPRDYLMELVRILGTVLGGSSRYLRLLTLKADECLQVRLRGDLSQIEAWNNVRGIEEVSNDDETFNDEIDDAVIYGPRTFLE
ncbi:hypothetical protein V492_04950 [Pseudogymnoascus sp. VKM F-4246]|nr:hypothetical protein V492_04950 [Pseudogymnoascus sp. VKM F-4246]